MTRGATMAIAIRVDRLFTGATLAAERLGTRASWRLGRALRAATTSAHEAVLALGRRRRWLDAGLEPIPAVRPPAALPAYPSLRPPATEVSRAAARLARGAFELADDSTVPVEQVSWRRPPRGRTGGVAGLGFHALEPVKELLDAYWLTGAPEYREQATALAHRWIDECLYAERDERVWDDHATALRAIVLCQLWGAWATEPSASPFARDLRAALVRHAGKLAHPAFYRPRHNHGVTQAHALLALGLLLSAHPVAARWVELGRARLEAQARDNVSADGLFREHSPFYHFFVLRQLLDARRLGRAYHVAFSRELDERLDAMLAAGAHLLRPDGGLPALGDTARRDPVFFAGAELRELPGEGAREYLFSAGAGEAGTQPAATSVLCPGGGVAVLRSGWGEGEPFRGERHLTVRLATFPTSHIHRDVLSFELYAHGDDLIVDSGGPYAYGHPIRSAFLVTTRAHNTVVVDDADQEIGAARILHWETAPSHDALVAEHRAYPGVAHRRAIVFVRPHYFLVVDRLVADRPRRFGQLFHLNPDLRATLDDLAVVTEHRRGGPTIRIVPLATRHLGVRLHRGTRAPRQGWVCLGGEALAANAVVEYQRSGRQASFATLLLPEAPGTSDPAWATLEGEPFAEEARVLVLAGGLGHEILLAPSGEVTITASLAAHAG